MRMTVHLLSEIIILKASGSIKPRRVVKHQIQEPVFRSQKGEGTGGRSQKYEVRSQKSRVKELLG